jgi:predicted nucleotidyltransferase
MADARTTAAKLTAHLRSAFAADLRSVVVFGSLPRGEFIPGVSDLNLLVLLESMGAPTLVRAAPVLQQWIRQGNTPPYLYSWEEWGGMQDSFAIEISDMNDAREVLWGADPVVVDSVTYAGLRQQTEREIRDTLLHLRLRLMVATSGPNDIGSLLLSGLPSFTAYMRAVLRLAGQKPGLETRPVIERAAALIGADPTPMLTCFDARTTTHHLEVQMTDSLLDQYLGFVRTLLQHVDALPANYAGPDGDAQRRSGHVFRALPASPVGVTI